MPIPHPEPGRSRILAAAAVDAALVVALHAGAAVLAAAWLLARSGFGRRDLAEIDAAVAVALVGAAAPAWVAWTLLAARWRLPTPGQSVARIRPVGVDGAPRYALYVRAAAAPLSLPGWLWSAATPLLAGLPPWCALPSLVGAAGVAAAGLGSLGLLLVRPRPRLLHDRVARTALVTAEP